MREQNPQQLLVKDVLINATKVKRIAFEIKNVYTTFDIDEFMATSLHHLHQLELKARIVWLAQNLKNYLPIYPQAVEILLKALPPANNPDLVDDDFGDFIYAVYSEYVAQNGCCYEYLDISLDALYHITQRFSVEYAIRHFINQFPEQTLAILQKWASDTHYHVRRLASEGLRPKLPWAVKINLPYQAALPVLDILFTDTTRFVTRSVANHLNDITKIDPDLVIEKLEQWQTSNLQNHHEMAYITRHALRTLIKEGNAKAYNLLGLSPNINCQIRDFKMTPIVKINEYLKFSFKLDSNIDTKAVIHYIIYFQSKAGLANRKKVFKIGEFDLEKDLQKDLKKEQSKHIEHKHLFKNLSTRQLYAGAHEIEIQINGQKVHRCGFELVVHS